MRYVVIISRIREGMTAHSAGTDSTIVQHCDSVDDCQKHIEDSDSYVIIDKIQRELIKTNL